MWCCRKWMWHTLEDDHRTWRNTYKTQHWAKVKWIVPIHCLEAHHWVLCIVDHVSQHIVFFDSFGERKEWMKDIEVSFSGFLKFWWHLTYHSGRHYTHFSPWASCLWSWKWARKQDFEMDHISHFCKPWLPLTIYMLTVAFTRTRPFKATHTTAASGFLLLSWLSLEVLTSLDLQKKICRGSESIYLIIVVQSSYRYISLRWYESEMRSVVKDERHWVVAVEVGYVADPLSPRSPRVELPEPLLIRYHQ